MSEDPIGFAAGDANLYRYVGNSPTNFVDPSGLVCEGAAWGTAIGGTIGGIGGWIICGAGGVVVGAGGGTLVEPGGGTIIGGAAGGAVGSSEGAALGAAGGGLIGGAIGCAWDWIRGNRPVCAQRMPNGDNEAANRKFKQICDETDPPLNKDQRRQLHDEISKQNYTEDEIREIRDQMFHRNKPK